MPGLEGLPADWQAPATAFFVIAVVLFSAWARVFGKKEIATPKVQEFAVTGQLADMSPVKQLVEDVGLLVQQQVRTNLATEAMTKAIEANTKAQADAAAALAKAAAIYAHRVEDEQREREIEEEVERRLRERDGK